MVNGVNDKILESVETVREYIFDALQNIAIDEAEYTAFIELLIADLENAPPYDEL